MYFDLTISSSASPILAVNINFQSVSAGHKYGTTRPADKDDISSNTNENASIKKGIKMNGGGTDEINEVLIMCLVLKVNNSVKVKFRTAIATRFKGSRLRLKCDGTRAETRFCLSAKRTSPFK